MTDIDPAGLRVALVVLALAAASAACAAEFHVAPDGKDDAEGTEDAPFATLERARDAARAARAAEPYAYVTVTVHAGTYELPRTFELGPEDSGAPGAPVVWRAAKGEEVRLVAGRMVGAWKRVTDPEVLGRLDESARGKVMMADLRGQGVTDYGDMSGGFGKGGSTGAELFVNDEPMTISRYPNEGFIRIAKVLGASEVDVRGTKGCKEGVFQYEGDRPSRWAAEKDARVLGYWFWDWADQRHKVESIDPATRTIRVREPYHGYGYRAGQWFYGFNLLSEIDRPGEWYLDREAGIAYVWPPEGRAPKRAMVSLLPSAVKVKGAAHVTLRGFVIEGARGTGVELENCRECAVVACTVRNHGSWGVRIEGGSACAVRGSDVYGTGDGGISLSGGERRTLSPARHVAENNHIHHYSRWNRTYRPGLSLNGVGNRAAHNLIHHAPHQAVGFGGNDHVIEMNEIHNVCEETNDAGVMYAWNDWAGRGHVIRHNFIHHVYGHEGRGCMGVYLDDCFSSAELTGNVFWIVPRAAFIGGGRDCLYANNIFIDCRPAIHVDARGLGWRAYGKPELIQKLEKWPYREEPWRSRYPELLTLLDNEPMAPKGNVIERNICVGGKWADIEKKAEPHITVRNNMLEGDPRFVDAAKGDFQLRRDSPAWATGFKRIPFDEIGLRAGPDRASWPVEHQVDVRDVEADKRAAARPHPGAPLAVKRAPNGIAIDGRIAEGEWPDATVTLAEDPGRGRIKGAPCTARISHNRRYLFVAVTVPLKDAARLGRGARWGQDDGMEVCLRRHDKRKPGPTFILHGFPSGRKESSRDAGATQAEALGLLAGTRYAARVTQDGWTGEWAIPLREAGVRYSPRVGVGFNAGVFRKESGEWIIWAGALGATWQLDNSGLIVLE